MNKTQKFFIAQVGKTHGLHGDLKLHLHTDFPEQFKVGYSFDTSSGSLEILRINLDRGIVTFRGYEGIDYAKKLTNTKIYATLEETKERCDLKEGEHFWFEIEECSVVEDDEVLGKIIEIQRLADVNYMFIETDNKLIENGLAKTFLVPYIERYVLKSDVKAKMVLTKDAKEILEAS
ncbi:16S rRNA processing protein RimM [Sulfurovum sp. bin170]|uniref:ribosome maturation factor RimM n=1 Tax=Sulfurovum sp. bin170 TaxID=2695268 RepID=UPI0013DFDE08|nr:ribosome maturation factor RimM [Sulfurovum sp. bin170]NEW61349.1 16S rRNA processing protein RimM [Sulfurovum sp. bin170]